MDVAIFSDEVHKEDFVRALKRIAEWGVRRVEVRAIDGNRLPKVPTDVLDRFIRTARDLDLVISGLSPGFFKCDLDSPDVQVTFDDALPRLCDLAGDWDTNLVTCFSFKRRGGATMPAEVIDRLGQAADRVRAGGCQLVVENVAACWGATGAETGAILRQVGVDRIGLCWDPGNAARGGAEAPFPDDYDGVKDLVRHVHVKNFVPELGDWGLVDTGLIDWQEQVGALRADGYNGLLVIETHLTDRPADSAAPQRGMTPLEANTLDNLQMTQACMIA